MRKVCLGLLLCCFLILPVSGEMAAPPVPEAGERLMPAQNQSFSQGLRQIAGELLPLLRPELARALASGAGLVALCLLLALFPAEETGGTADLAGAVAIAALLMGNAHSMIRMAAETVTEMSEYEKLLLPVVTAAMAAQGGVNSATALYAGSAFFNTVLSALLGKLLLPVQYLFLGAATAGAALGNDTLKALKNSIRDMILWCMKTLLSLFTAYLGITGVVTGATDAGADQGSKDHHLHDDPNCGRDSLRCLGGGAGGGRGAAQQPGAVWDFCHSGGVFRALRKDRGAVPDSQGSPDRVRSVRNQAECGAHRRLRRGYADAAGHYGRALSAAAGELGMLFEGGGLMAGKYVLSLVTAALIGGIVTGFFPDGSFRRLLRLLCGVFLLTVVLAPVSALEMPDLDSWLAGLDMDAWDAVQQGEDYVALRRREGICERLEAYTLDKAAALGADVSVRFTLDDQDLPRTVTLTGSCTPAQKQALARVLAEDLGIPEERQIWQ